MGRKMNPKSQENNRQNQDFLQILLLQTSETARHIKGVRVLHRGLVDQQFDAPAARKRTRGKAN
jgi:hypothetical protein